MTGIELVFRLIIIPLALFNLCYTFNGPRAFARGIFRAPYYYMTFVFFASLTTLAYEAWHFIEPGDDLWRFTLLSLSIITGAVGIIGFIAGGPLMTERFALIYKALPQALAIATLAEYDPAEADLMAEDCWARVKSRVQAGAVPKNG